ncbi:MAG TPA: hypothetical protein VGI73_16265 [Solirubrobacterales bacterium]
MGARRHPQSRDQLRSLFVKIGTPTLIAILLGLMVGAALLFALVLALASARPGAGFFTVWKDELMILLGLPVDGLAANRGSGVAQGVAVAAGVLALILPALYVGAIVSRLFIHPDVFVFRRKIALLPSPETFRDELAQDGHVMAIRLYNGSRMRALDVHFEVVHQHWFDTGSGSIVRNLAVGVANPSWPMADRHVPYTLFACLVDGDVARDDDHLVLRAIKGRAIDPRDRLVVHVLGTMPEVGEAFSERHAFNLAGAVTDESWGGVDVSYGSNPRSWHGWERFDG